MRGVWLLDSSVPLLSMKCSRCGIISRSEGTFGLSRKKCTLSKVSSTTCWIPLPSPQVAGGGAAAARTATPAADAAVPPTKESDPTATATAPIARPPGFNLFIGASPSSVEPRRLPAGGPCRASWVRPGFSQQDTAERPVTTSRCADQRFSTKRRHPQPVRAPGRGSVCWPDGVVHDGASCPQSGHAGGGTSSIDGGRLGSSTMQTSEPGISFSMWGQAAGR